MSRLASLHKPYPMDRRSLEIDRPRRAVEIEAIGDAERVATIAAGFSWQRLARIT